jgi:hypothetical protein
MKPRFRCTVVSNVRYVPFRKLLQWLSVLPFAVVVGCSYDGSPTTSSIASYAAMRRATCGPHDRPESALQGQVPATLRQQSRFTGFQCNLELVSQIKDEGAGWQSAFATDDAGHVCAYYDTSPSAAGRKHMGVAVIDVTDAARPKTITYLTTPGMVDPAETLKVNEKRKLLVAVTALGAPANPQLDLYDLAVDCRFPRLLISSSGPSQTMTQQGALRANEASFSPDGSMLYATSLREGVIQAIDIRKPASPTVTATWSMPFNQRTSGLSISDDGRRAYFTLFGEGAAAPSSNSARKLTNGLLIADVTDAQQHSAHPQVKVVSSIVWGDGSASHQTLPVQVGGKDYLIAVDEGGSGYSSASGWRAACNARLPAWSMARIVDISNERRPTIVARLQLEMNLPENCDQVLPDLTGLDGFTYGSHYCSVDDSRDAAVLACGYLQSGVRVFDIRAPLHPKEIAYFVPPAIDAAAPGSVNNNATPAGRVDRCSAQTRIDTRSGTMMTTCQDNGFLILKFTNSVWPVRRRPPDIQ